MTVEKAVAGKTGKHVVKKSDSRLSPERSFPVQTDPYVNLRFLRLSLDGTDPFAHQPFLPSSSNRTRMEFSWAVSPS